MAKTNNTITAAAALVRGTTAPAIQEMRTADGIEYRADTADAVKAVMKEIRANMSAMEKSDGAYTSLFRKAVNTAYWNNAPELVVYFLEAAKSCRSAPWGQTIAVLRDICGISVRKVTEKPSGRITYRARGIFTTPEQLSEMNRTLKDSAFTIRGYKPERTPKDAPTYEGGRFELIGQMLDKLEKKITKDAGDEEPAGAIALRLKEIAEVRRMIADALAAESAA